MSDDEASRWSQQHMDNLSREMEGYENSDDSHVKEWQVELLERQVREIADRVDEIPTKLEDLQHTLASRLGTLESALWLLGTCTLVLLALLLWRLW